MSSSTPHSISGSSDSLDGSLDSLEQHPSGAGVARLFDDIVRSAEPAVVFTSVARLCVPLICDAASITIQAPDQPAYTINWPRADVGIATLHVAGNHATIPIQSAGMVAEHREFHGNLAIWFDNDRRDTNGPDSALLAQLLVQRAVAIVDSERLVETTTLYRERADNLELALASNREIGIAMGILMSSYQLTSDQSFDLLRRVSQRGHRKIRDIAMEVAETGAIDLPAGVALTAKSPRPGPELHVSADRSRPRPFIRCAPRS